MINSVALLLVFCSFTIVHGDIPLCKFVVTWPNAFCTQREGICDMTKVPQEFKIHGLWPFDGSSSCETPYQFTKAELRRDRNFFRELNDKWPSLVVNRQNMEFWRREWIKHGSCTGMNPMEYFQTSLELMRRFQRIDLLNHFNRIGIAPSNILHNPMVFPDRIVSKSGLITETTCNNDVHSQNQLYEIIFCVSRSGNFVNCTVNRDGSYILRGCKSGVRFTPLRRRVL